MLEPSKTNVDVVRPDFVPKGGVVTNERGCWCLRTSFHSVLCQEDDAFSLVLHVGRILIVFVLEAFNRLQCELKMALSVLTVHTYRLSKHNAGQVAQIYWTITKTSAQALTVRCEVSLWHRHLPFSPVFPCIMFWSQNQHGLVWTWFCRITTEVFEESNSWAGPRYRYLCTVTGYGLLLKSFREWHSCWPRVLLTCIITSANKLRAYCIILVNYESLRTLWCSFRFVWTVQLSFNFLNKKMVVT